MPAAVGRSGPARRRTTHGPQPPGAETILPLEDAAEVHAAVRRALDAGAPPRRAPD